MRKMAAKGIKIESQVVDSGFKMVGRVVKPSEEEVGENPRARSAKLRFYVKNAKDTSDLN